MGRRGGGSETTARASRTQTMRMPVQRECRAVGTATRGTGCVLFSRWASVAFLCSSRQDFCFLPDALQLGSCCKDAQLGQPLQPALKPRCLCDSTLQTQAPARTHAARRTPQLAHQGPRH